MYLNLTSSPLPRGCHCFVGLCLLPEDDELEELPDELLDSVDDSLVEDKLLSSRPRRFFFMDSKSSKSTQHLCLGKWATPAYDTVDLRNAGQSSHAYTRGLSCAVGKTATP